ncbi:MAG: membrane protein insertion efficiency factor YidD [Terriglobia bacterium]|jgi:putative membrane protein insertion efficiency factor|nr:membrane protein insertion efficiency factor YidD [Terriglobia bacterium]
METIILAVLRAYKRYLSPMLPTACRYVPTCSEYAMEAIERKGVLRGSTQAIWRLLRCNPLGGHGYDPVKGNDCKCHERPRPRDAWMGHQEF